MSIHNIYNYLQLTESIATSGQPAENELRYIVEAGYDVVINLGLSDVEYSVKSEAEFFRNNEIIYIHQPVVFDRPTQSDLEKFFAILDKNINKNVFIHCAANKRVSVFMALYRIKALAWPVEKAIEDIHVIWHPDALWQSFLDYQCHIEPER